MLQSTPTISDIQHASQRIKPFIHRTPVLTSQSLNQKFGCSFFFKCENFQKIGAFKMRGATNKITQLAAADPQLDFATHSSGNHAQAVALSAAQHGRKAYIVMPENAPKVKVNAVSTYGGEVTFCEPTLAAREETLQKILKKTDAAFIPPYDDYDIIAGQATAALELATIHPQLQALLAPIGGGGLLAGSALAARALIPNIEIWGAEPEGADDAKRSFDAGRIIPKEDPQTIADGLLTTIGQKNLTIIREHVRDILVVDDTQIISAMRLIWERLNIIIEPSCAVPFAVVMNYPEHFEGKNVGIILSGGNVDLDQLPW